ncbi:MAG: hypothetical protein O7H41_20010 [Planctomycetota bacterium]|nr:hypothetical protein [Planctomycetota bacterium]
MNSGICQRTLFVAVTLSLFLIPSASAHEEGDRESDLKAIHSLIEAGEFKDASKALKAYKKKYGRSAEEKERIESLTDLLEGSKDLAKIEDDYRKKQKPRRTAEKLGRLVEDFSQHPSLVKRATALLDAIRSEYVLVLEDFEGRKTGNKELDKLLGRLGVPRAKGMTLTDDPRYVKHGKWSCRWKLTKGGSTHVISTPENDFSGYDYFCAWIYNGQRGGRPAQLRVDATSGWDTMYSYVFAVDWKGWREIRMPLRGRNSKFSRHGAVDWSAINFISIAYSAESPGPLNIVIDDIRMEKAVK